MSHRQYLVTFSGVAGLGLALLALSLFFVWRGGEVKAAQDVVSGQERDPHELYGTALNQNTYAYKVALAQQGKPKVLIAGSSRVMQFRAGNFRQSQVTGGGAGGSVEEVSSFLDAATSAYTPEVVIVGVDFWWFHPEYKGSFRADLSGNEVTRDKLFWVFQQVQHRRISVGEMLRVLRGPRPDRTGFLAIFRDQGFRVDGSWQYNLAPDNRDWQREVKFANTIERIHGGTDQFLHGARADVGRLALLDSMVDRLQARGIRVLMFMPPIAPTIHAHLVERAADFQYIEQVRGHTWHAPMLDFFDPATLGAEDCEFIDGYHGGDIVYARIAQRLADASQGALASTPENMRIAALRGRPAAEVTGTDHLALGCAGP